MRGTLTVDGVNLTTTYGVHVSGDGTYKSAKKSYNFYNIPNKNGLILASERHFDNVNIVYHCGIANNFETNIAGLRDFIMSRDGYVKISDSYHNDEYRMGIYEGPFDPEVQPSLDAAEFDLVFNCKPQRWLNSGDTSVAILSGSSNKITNPTKQLARPLIKVTGKDGYIYIGPYSARYRIFLSTTAPDASPVTYIDCETMDCYYADGTNANLYVNIRKGASGTYTLSDTFPVLISGEQACYWANTSGTQYGITAAEITPRWWRA